MTDAVEVWKGWARASIRQRTDVHSSAPSVRVSISLGFALLAAFLGWRWGFTAALLTFGGLLSVVLTQELPKALVARASGTSSRVVISTLGGQTELSGAPLRGVAALAFETVGSVANLLVAAGTLVLAELGPGLPSNVVLVLRALATWHVVWGLGQILPVLPFRCGYRRARKFSTLTRSMHAALSATLWLVLGALLATWQSTALLVPVITFAGCASGAAFGSAAADRRDERSGAKMLATQADALLRQGDPARACLLANKGLLLARSKGLRTQLWETLAWAAIGKQEPLLAHSALAQLPPTIVDYYIVAAYLSCCNRIDEALQLLREARTHGHRDRETTKLAIDLLLRRGDSGTAMELAQADGSLLSADDWTAIEAAVGMPASLGRVRTHEPLA